MSTEERPVSVPGAFPDFEDESEGQAPCREPLRPVDVLVLRNMLMKSANLPIELVDMIIDHAEYWPSTETALQFGTRSRLAVRGHSPTEDVFILRTPPIGFSDRSCPGDWTTKQGSMDPHEERVPTAHFRALLNEVQEFEHPVKKVVFKIRSNDQGWGGMPQHRGTFRGSWTWFEAGLERFDGSASASAEAEPPAPPFHFTSLRSVHPRTRPTIDGEGHEYSLGPDPRLTIQRNKTAKRDPCDYEVVWSCNDGADPDSYEAEKLDEAGRGKASGDGDFVRNLRLGDVITVWGKARFDRWVNYVEKISVEVYWAV